MTNPENVGGLNDHKPVPLSEELRIEAAMISGDVYVRGDAFVARMTRMAEQAERLEELCRAAPAGSGDVSDEEIADLSRLLEEYAIAADTWADTKKLGKAAALLRKLQQPAEEDAYVIEQMGRLLAEIAIIVNGPEPALTKWSYHDLPEKVRKLQQGAESFVSCTCHEERQKALCLNKHRCVRAYPLASQGQEGGNG